MELFWYGGALGVAVLILLFGRKRLAIALPCAIAFIVYASIAIPNILPPRTVAARNACVANLTWIENAKSEWARKNNKLPGDTPLMEDLFGSNKSAPCNWVDLCPAGGEYKLGAVNEHPTCTRGNEGHALK
jgi:hypothetical protein